MRDPKGMHLYTLLYTLIIIGAFNSSYGKSANFNYNAKNISSYFSALISFDDYHSAILYDNDTEEQTNV